MEWFRMYHDARKDKKLQSLTDSQFRVWFDLLCMASEQSENFRGRVPFRNTSVLALEVAHGDETLLEQTLAKLVSLDILQQKKSQLIFVHWSKRQFASDSSAARVKKHREKKSDPAKPDAPTVAEPGCNGDVTLQSRYGNGDVTLVKQDVTPPDTDTDTEQIQNKDQKTQQPRAKISVAPDISLAQSFSTHDERQLTLQTAWRKTMGLNYEPQEIRRLIEFCDDAQNPLDVAVVVRAMEVTADIGKRHYAYLLKVLKNWQRDGLCTVALLDAHEQRRQEAKAASEPIRAAPPSALASVMGTPDSDPSMRESEKQIVLMAKLRGQELW